MSTSMYQITAKVVDPLADLLKAVVEVNWHLNAADQSGWETTLSVDPESGQLAVKVERSRGWPTPEDSE